MSCHNSVLTGRSADETLCSLVLFVSITGHHRTLVLTDEVLKGNIFISNIFQPNMITFKVVLSIKTFLSIELAF